MGKKEVFHQWNLINLEKSMLRSFFPCKHTSTLKEYLWRARKKQKKMIITFICRALKVLLGSSLTSVISSSPFLFSSCFFCSSSFFWGSFEGPAAAASEDTLTTSSANSSFFFSGSEFQQQLYLCDTTFSTFSLFVLDQYCHPSLSIAW